MEKCKRNVRYPCSPPHTQVGKLPEAGAVYLSVLAGVGPAASLRSQQGYTALLEAIRRERSYFTNLRSVDAKMGEGASTRVMRHPNVFDQRKCLDDGSFPLRRPTPPSLRAENATTTTVELRWQEPDAYNGIMYNV